MARKKSPSTLSRFEVAARRIDDSARAIIEAETAARDAKVKSLRKARLERDALEVAQTVVSQKKSSKPVRAKRQTS